MAPQPESILEAELVKQLQGLGYNKVSIKGEADLITNLQKQLEKHNNIKLSAKEFAQVLNQLNKGGVFERAKILRDKCAFFKDNGDAAYLEFINQEHWCQNQFQVTHQVTIEGIFLNRYDVTILINGLPLAQIELKRRGLELREAFNQTNRYQRHSYAASYGLFNYIQLFIISNGVNTKYYANNRKQDFEQTFCWSDTDNKRINQLSEFAQVFLEPCHLSKMITKFVVLNETFKIMMVCRPYQYYATELIIERVKNSIKNGYIWHTTGSGKTLTSFKASQLLMKLPQVHKVVFVVDRKDLDYQTVTEFNLFSKGSVDGTDDTRMLVRQFSDDTKLIVTTIQKLNTAISKKQHLAQMEMLKDKRIVFIFDECHRSQFGDTHTRIKKFFSNVQMFGFTGTPIFAKNAVKNMLGRRTTKELFHDCLHKYVITDAIRDENVKKFSVEYIGRYRQKESSKSNLDIEVEALDTAELMEAPKRLEKIADYIIANHNNKTSNKYFTAIFCVNSVNTLIKYYDIFKAKQQAGEQNLRIATIFTFGINEDDKDANGFIPEDGPFTISGPINSHSRDKLDEYIKDYNAIFGTKHSAKDGEAFYTYSKDISKRIKERERENAKDADRVDILLVVNMFLTGFDAKRLNTLYVDKNLKYHGLIQAFSRTNRNFGKMKTQGNIVCFRNLKQATDDAITLFSNKEAIEEIIMQPYENYVEKFNAAVSKLKAITPTVDSVDDLVDENAELEFVKAFREMIRIKTIMTSFSDFSFEELEMDEQSFEDYKSKYLDIYDKTKKDSGTEKTSILDDVDFELELIHRDEINVAYILQLLAKLKTSNPRERAQQRKAIMDLLTGEIQLRSKKELIEKFIDENLPVITEVNDIPEAFASYVEVEKNAAFQALCENEKVDSEKLNKVMGDYLFTGLSPMPDNIVNMLQIKPKLLERKSIIERIIIKIKEFVETYISGVSDEAGSEQQSIGGRIYPIDDIPETQAAEQ
ncbi:MAG: type I restriction endonuclease subunit R [Ferruginibacter sp.]